MSAAPVVTMFQSPSLRLALGLGDQELEQRLRPAFDASPDLLVVAQCLSADQVVHAVEAGHVDAVVVAWTLHRLTDAVLDHLEQSRLPVVVLVADPTAERWRQRRSAVLSLDSAAEVIRQALLVPRAGGRPLSRPRPDPQPVQPQAVDRGTVARSPGVIAVVGGVGSPGRTTLALNLAAALGAAAPTALVEIDLDGPALAAYLDRDPTRNVCTLAHAVRDEPRVWGTALDDEIQALHRHSRHGVVLCGPPKREMRTTIAPAFVERLVAEMAARYRFVVCDVGPSLSGMDSAAANHRAALIAAQQVLVVSRSDFVGLWHTRTLLDQLEHHVGFERSQLALVLNRHDARHHHPPAEVEWHLGVPIVAVVSADSGALERATAAQQPVVFQRASRAGRAFIQLAEQLFDGRLAPYLTAARGQEPVPWWRRPFQRQSGSQVSQVAEPLEPVQAPLTRAAPGRAAW